MSELHTYSAEVWEKQGAIHFINKTEFKYLHPVSTGVLTLVMMMDNTLASTNPDIATEVSKPGGKMFTQFAEVAEVRPSFDELQSIERNRREILLRVS